MTWKKENQIQGAEAEVAAEDEGIRVHAADVVTIIHHAQQVAQGDVATARGQAIRHVADETTARVRAAVLEDGLVLQDLTARHRILTLAEARQSTRPAKYHRALRKRIE